MRVRMDDSWFHVATFCDVRPRAALHTAHRHCHRHWEDLILFHTGFAIPLGMFKCVWEGEWEFLMAFVRLGRHIELRSGKSITCWTPWCAPNHLQLHARGIYACLKMDYSEDHARFIMWIRRLVCTKRRCSLMQPRQLVCSLRWSQPYRIPVRKNAQTVYAKYRLMESPFRVKVSIRDTHHPMVSNGYPRLTIECFEFRGIDIRNDVGPRMLLKNE